MIVKILWMYEIPNAISPSFCPLFIMLYKQKPPENLLWFLKVFWLCLSTYTKSYIILYLLLCYIIKPKLFFGKGKPAKWKPNSWQSWNFLHKTIRRYWTSAFSMVISILYIWPTILGGVRGAILYYRAPSIVWIWSGKL